VARRKRKKSKTKRISFKLGTSKRKKKQKAGQQRPSSTGILKVFVVVCVLGAVGTGVFAVVRVGFEFLDKYVRKVAPVSEEFGSLELVNVPPWITESLKEKIYAAARANGEDLKLDEDAARSVQNNLEREVAWLQNVTVQTTHDTIRIEAKWRRPIALVKRGMRKYYVDAEMVVLDFVPIPRLPIVEVKSLSTIRKVPPTGTVWQRNELAAAVDVLKLLWRMDEEVTPDKPLLWEIEAIDVSNFEGREDTRIPHIVLYATDNTEIIWGAEVGTWQQYLEAKDEDKLLKLYGYYKEHGSLLGVKYINLRDPQDKIPLPIDKY
jgi:hypothetical protein